MHNKVCVVYTHHKLGDLIWQIPYIKAISEHHNSKVDLIVRSKTQARIILKDSTNIKNIYYNDFRKGFFYWIDVLKIFKIFKKLNYTHVYFLDKVNKPAIAAKLAKIPNRIGPGIKNQKKWLTNEKVLSDNDYKLNYSEQSKKLLSLNKINIESFVPKIDIDINDFLNIHADIIRSGKKIAFGVDSFEDYKMWYEEYFVELASKLHQKGLFDFIYLICGPDKSYIAKKIIKLSNKNYFIDCSNKDLSGIITAIKSSNFYLGNNSGPLNLASALGIRSFGLIANDPASELKYSNIETITPIDYVDNIWNRNRIGMRKLTVDHVYNNLINKLETK